MNNSIEDENMLLKLIDEYEMNLYEWIEKFVEYFCEEQLIE